MEDGRYGLYGRDMTSMIRTEELQEEDVWSVVKTKNREDVVIGRRSRGQSSMNVNPCRATLVASGSRMIPKVQNTAQEPRITRQSAPLNIPDWSKIYGIKSSSSRSEKVPFLCLQQQQEEEERTDTWDSVDEDEEEDDDEDGDGDHMVPPHEWLARKQARSHVSSFSVCEGVGRTLKGRDLRRVRNSVLAKTGFLE